MPASFTLALMFLRLLIALSLCFSAGLQAAKPGIHIYKKVADRELKLTIVNPPNWKAF
jgi:hypothetical protein